MLGHEELACCFCADLINPGIERLQCLFCHKNSHINCTPDMCPCITHKSLPMTSPGIPITYRSKGRESSLKILMPKAYMRSSTLEEGEVVKLLALRRFKYTRVPVVSIGYHVNYPERYWEVANWVKLPSFKKYISGDYWPPV